MIRVLKVKSECQNLFENIRRASVLGHVLMLGELAADQLRHYRFIILYSENQYRRFTRVEALVEL